MDATLLEYKDFLVAGVSLEADSTSDLSAAWTQLYAQLTPEQAEAAAKLQKVGVSMPTEDPGYFIYTAGFMVPNIPAVAALGLTGIVVPASMYATVHLVGPASQTLKGGFEYLMKDYIPSRPMQATGVAIEVYGPGDMTADDYRMYAWAGIISEKSVEELAGLR